MNRVLGVDWGRNRLGVAVADSSGIAPMPLEIVYRPKAGGSVLDLVCEVAKREEVEEIVVGLPITLSGTEGPSAKLARGFAKALEERCGIKVSMYDERLTSVEASRLLARRVVSRSQPRKRSPRPSPQNDSIAAALMLESCLRQRKLSSEDDD